MRYRQGKHYLTKIVKIGKKSAICLSNAFKTLQGNAMNANQFQVQSILAQDCSHPLKHCLICFLYRDILKTSSVHLQVTNNKHQQCD